MEEMSSIPPERRSIGQRTSIWMAYYWIELALTALAPSARAEVARDLHTFIVELTELQNDVA